MSRGFTHSDPNPKLNLSFWVSSPAEAAFQVSLPGFKFSSPELGSLAISHRERREVAGSYGSYRQGVLNINNEFDGWWIYFMYPSGEQSIENTFGRAREERKMSDLFGRVFCQLECL